MKPSGLGAHGAWVIANWQSCQRQMRKAHWESLNSRLALTADWWLMTANWWPPTTNCHSSHLSPGGKALFSYCCNGSMHRKNTKISRASLLGWYFHWFVTVKRSKLQNKHTTQRHKASAKITKIKNNVYFDLPLCPPERGWSFVVSWRSPTRAMFGGCLVKE